MSSKSSLFLTNDNEHCYEECNEPHYDGEKFKGYTIVLEMAKRNIEILINDNEDLIVELKPGSELYELVRMMRK